MKRLLITDDAGNTLPIAMYDNWFFAGGTWRPENPGFVYADADDDENNEWLDIDDKNNPGYVCRMFSTKNPRYRNTLGSVFRLAKFARKNGTERTTGQGHLVPYANSAMHCGDVDWKRI